MTAQTEVLNLINLRNQAVSRGDPDAVIAPLADDIVSYDLQPPLQYEGAAARDTDGLRQWFATWNGPVRVEMPKPAVRVGDDLAVAHGLSRMRGDKKGGGNTDLWFRTTLILARRDGGWKIVHEHNSVPMKMDGSGLAALDLKP